MEQTLNGKWWLLADPEKKGVNERWFDFSTFETIKSQCIETDVPSNWNLHKPLEKYEGICWYFKKFDVPKTSITKDKIYRLIFKGSNYISKIYLDGHYLGENEGGFLPFVIPIERSILQESDKHFLAVSVDNTRTRTGIPSFNTDWYNYGGIHRDVLFEVIPLYRIERIYITPKLVSNNLAKIDIEFDIINAQRYIENQLRTMAYPSINYKTYYCGNRSSKSNQKINRIMLHESEIAMDQIGKYIIYPKQFLEDSSKKPQKSQVSDDEPEFEINSDTNGEPGDSDSISKQFDQTEAVDDVIEYPHKIRVRIEQEIQDPVLWDTDNPELYEIELSLNGVPEIQKTTFGIREIKTKGVGLYLNRKLLKIKGVSLHEEQVPFGRHYPEEMRRKEILHIKELGLNTIRSSHYSHDEVMVKIADEEGVLIFEEIPLYWDCTFHDRHTQLLALKMLKTLVDRDYNHPSVIVWSVGNEIPVELPSCTQAIRNFLKFTKSLDQSRLVTYVTARFWNDTLRRETDLVCQNEYLGWYFGRVNQLNMLLESIYPTAPKQPWIMSEFGACADYYAQGKDKGEKYSMEYQYYFLKKSIEIFNSKPWISGWIIWIYRDFKSPLRTNRFQRGFNRKGIVTEDNIDKIIAKNSHAVFNSVAQNVKRHPVLGRFVYALVKKLVDAGMIIGQKFADKSIKEKIDSYYAKYPQNE